MGQSDCRDDADFPAGLVGGTITLSSDADVYAAYGDAPALPTSAVVVAKDSADHAASFGTVTFTQAAMDKTISSASRTEIDFFMVFSFFQYSEGANGPGTYAPSLQHQYGIGGGLCQVHKTGSRLSPKAADPKRDRGRGPLLVVDDL